MEYIKGFFKENLYFYVCIFFVACVFGWMTEVVFRTVKAGYLIIPGFLHGCYLPIYGFGAILLVFCFEKMTFMHLKLLKINVIPFVVFVCCFVLLSAVEYITHFVMGRYLNVELWSYSAHKYNINGRISLNQSLMFGLSGTWFLYILYPRLKNRIEKLNVRTLKASAIIITIVVSIDFILSVAQCLC